ncbi:hypothetical protein AUJ68_02890 [Candidatus Woesearchaeota archaeon CG1_02_57_44]|nr:MAG: hypothetical protein AUJ68_02890 [Candidatus Woesearchaeota archaeon CG1_02_57_44]
MAPGMDSSHVDQMQGFLHFLAGRIARSDAYLFQDLVSAGTLAILEHGGEYESWRSVYRSADGRADEEVMLTQFFVPVVRYAMLDQCRACKARPQWGATFLREQEQAMLDMGTSDTAVIAMRMGLSRDEYQRRARLVDPSGTVSIDDSEAGLLDVVGDADAAYDAVLEHDQGARYLRGLDALPVRERRLLVEVGLRGQTFASMASNMRLSPGRADQLYQQAKDRMREQVDGASSSNGACHHPSLPSSLAYSYAGFDEWHPGPAAKDFFWRRPMEYFSSMIGIDFYLQHATRDASLLRPAVVGYADRFDPLVHGTMEALLLDANGVRGEDARDAVTVHANPYGRNDSFLNIFAFALETIAAYQLNPWWRGDEADESLGRAQALVEAVFERSAPTEAIVLASRHCLGLETRVAAWALGMPYDAVRNAMLAAQDKAQDLMRG